MISICDVSSGKALRMQLLLEQGNAPDQSSFVVKHACVLLSSCMQRSGVLNVANAAACPIISLPTLSVVLHPLIRHV